MMSLLVEQYFILWDLTWTIGESKYLIDQVGEMETGERVIFLLVLLDLYQVFVILHYALRRLIVVLRFIPRIYWTTS